MPTLNWIGKDKVLNHHQDVPYRILEGQYTYNSEKSDNLIIHGDNLEALKSLLPRYEGRVNCIYIDPPYNTGNEGWVYNDKVNDPKILKWLNEVVGKEGEDLSRHDKWLCMMYPRLRLLHKLLASDGAIFISIDDNEQANLKLMMDEIFGSGNFIGTICWQKKQSPQNDAINLSSMHDFIIVYAKTIKRNRNDELGWNRNLILKTEEQTKRYKNPDNDPKGNWASGDCTSNKTKTERPSLYYPIINPTTGEEIWPSEKTVWRFEKNTFQELIRANRIWFGKSGTNVPRLKIYESEVATGVVPSTWWTREFAGDNQEARRVFRNIFSDDELDFTTPKPPRLIERIIQIACDDGSLILDSFAGSGSTAHAVLNLNRNDGGNRKFILIETEDYAERITAERVRRVISGHNKTLETGGDFTFCTIGEPLFHPNNTLNESVGADRIREYIWYSETASPYQQPESSNPHYLGKKDDTGYYFYYEPDELTTLSHEFLSTITEAAGSYIIYADNCLLSKAFMQQKGIIFKKIPRDITRF